MQPELNLDAKLGANPHDPVRLDRLRRECVQHLYRALGTGVSSGDGGAATALYAGMLTAPGAADAPGYPLQTVQFGYTDTAVSTQRSITIQAVPLPSGCNFSFSSSDSGRVNLQLQNLAGLKWQSAAGADLLGAYVNGQDQLILGEGMQTIIVAAITAVWR